MPQPQRLRLVQLGETLGAVLPDGLQHLIPGRGVLGSRLSDDDRLVDQARNEVEDVLAGDLVTGANLLGGPEVEASREDRETCPHQLLRGRAEVETPANRGVQGLVPGGCGASAGGKESEPGLERVEDLR